MENGTIIKWNVGVGDEVSAGDVVADIETDKATMEMQVFDDGVIAGLMVDPGNQVPVGPLIAVLAEEGESVDDAVGERHHGLPFLPEIVLESENPDFPAAGDADCNPITIR